MPNTKSAKKALRQSKTHRQQNLKVIHAYKDAVKTLKQNANSDTFKIAQSQIDIAAKKNIINKNKARRLKSRLAKRVS